MKSMTGYGCSSYENSEYSIKIDVFSVNGKKCDVYVKTPSMFSFIEPFVRNIITEYISRGTIKVNLKVDINPSGDRVADNFRKKVREAAALMKIISEELSGEGHISVSDILTYPGLFEITDVPDKKEFEALIEKTLREALFEFNKTRVEEGANMSEDIAARVDILESNRIQIEKFSENVVEEYRNKIIQKVNDILDKDFDKYRFEQEIVYFAERADITEEIIRLHSHLKKFKELISSSEPIGKHFNFLVQEIQREFNTIGSKSKDIHISDLVILSKCEIEKIREQVQNIE